MPELPEVETIRRQLAPMLRGRRVLDADSHPSAKFLPARAIVGGTFGNVRRRGKYLILDIDDGRELIVHLGMTGSFELDPPGIQDTTGGPYRRAWWHLSSGNSGRDEIVVSFHDTRRFGRLRVVRAGFYDDIPTLARMGPEPQDVTPRGFHEAIRRSNRSVKTQLLSQRPIAGVGNIYADEALWHAGINPIVRRLSRPRADALLDALVECLDAAVSRGGTTLHDYRHVDGDTGTNQHHLHCYGRGGLPCDRCGNTFATRVIDQRTTTWCRHCQT